LPLAGSAGVQALVAGIDVNDDLGVGQRVPDFFFDAVAQLVGFFNRPVSGYNQVQIDEPHGTGLPAPEAVKVYAPFLVPGEDSSDSFFVIAGKSCVEEVCCRTSGEID
jgi:hypothetical protein